MKSRRLPVIGLLVMALCAGVALPAMADSGIEVTTDGQTNQTTVCLYVEIPEEEESSADIAECAYVVVLEWMPEEVRKLLLRELASMAEAAEAAQTAAETQKSASNYSYTAGVEQWRSLVAKYFKPGDVSHALSVIDCESIGGNPNAVNPSSGASGLFQHMPRYWEERSAKAGFEGANIFDPEANIAVAAWLAYTDGWHHWPNCG